MEKTAGTPIVIIAGATAAVFYGLYVLAGFGICISSFVFLTVLVVAAAGILYYYIGKRRNLFGFSFNTTTTSTESKLAKSYN